jgi:uncharacterized protein YndB with AHSA1/START domain
MRLLAVEPPRRLAFTWNAPPDLPNVRGQRTMVIVEFEPVGEDQTRVTLRHIGWGSGPEWEQALRYFGSAWSDVVLPRFRYRVQHGPIDWAAPPKLEPVAASMIESMVVAGP